MITIKSPAEIEKMRVAGRLTAETLAHVRHAVRSGISTGELDRIAHQFILERGGIPASLDYRGFPKSICTSINNVVCHGIPSDTEILHDGDIINIDIATVVDGWYGDSSIMVGVGSISDEAKLLIETTRECLELAIQHVKSGVRTRELGAIIEDHAASRGFTSVRDFVGHGIGRGYHEEPNILHYRNLESSVRLKPGMTFTIEPMLCAGASETWVDPNDGWTARTVDGSLSAQWEHTILVTEGGYEILTRA